MRLRPTGLYRSLGLGVIASAIAVPLALAQNAGDDSHLLNPVPSDPQRKPGFETLMRSEPPGFRPRAYGNPSGSGAGSTGFVSTNAKNKKKKIAVTTTPPAPIVVAPPDATLAPIYRPAAPTVRVQPSTSMRPADATGTVRPVKRLPEEDTFAPVGIRNGPFTYKPAVDVTTGYDSNPGRVNGGGGSLTTLVAPELLIASNWSRHELTATLKGNYAWYHDLPNFNRGMADLKTNARIDITSQTQANLEGRYLHSNDTPGNPNNPSDIASPPS